MITVKNMKDLEILAEKSELLARHLRNELTALFREYGIESLDSIGAFYVLENDSEYEPYRRYLCEFSKTLELSDGDILLRVYNAVYAISDGYAIGLYADESLLSERTKAEILKEFRGVERISFEE